MTGRYVLKQELPQLPGALCAGKWPQWDAYIDGEPRREAALRRQAAAAVCNACPVMAACEQARAGRSGVWAGKIYLAEKAPPAQPERRCSDCNWPMVPASQATKNPTLRRRYRVHHAHGLCTSCRSRHGRFERRAG